MSKIVVINGSHNKRENSYTAAFVEEFLKVVRKKYLDIECEHIMLNEKDIGLCHGCLSCTKTGKCIIDDDVQSILDSMQKADLIIMCTPVHISQVSTVLKNFLDRIFVKMHVFEFLGKPCINMVTTNGSGEKETLRYMRHVSNLLGMIEIGSIFKSRNDKFHQRGMDKLVGKTVKVLSEPSSVKPSLMNKLYFNSMRKIIRDNPGYFEYENRYWDENHWMEMRFMQIFKKKRTDRSS